MRSAQRWRATRCSALLALALSSACIEPVQTAPRAPVVRLASPTAFHLQVPDEPDRVCVVQRSEVEVTAVRGDTLLFRDATPLMWPYGAPRCTWAGRGFVNLAAHPDVQHERLGQSRGDRLGSVTLKTLGVLGVAIPLVILLAR